MTGVPLFVPDQAVIELDAWTDNVLADSDKRRAVVDIAAPVVAAELRRLADEYGAGILRIRADEVEAQ